MTALATQTDKTFVPSLLEAPGEFILQDKKVTKGSVASSPNYTIDTIRKLKQSFKKADRLFFLIGIDAFKDIAKWREAEALFGECEFIVASRPGFSLADVASSLPEKFRPREEVTKPFARRPAEGHLVLPGVTLHLLGNVNQNISATEIRKAFAAKRPIKRFLPEN